MARPKKTTIKVQPNVSTESVETPVVPVDVAKVETKPDTQPEPVIVDVIVERPKPRIIEGICEFCGIPAPSCPHHGRPE